MKGWLFFREVFFQMSLVPHDIPVDLRGFHDVVAHESRQRTHAEELVGFMEWEKVGVYAFAFEELSRFRESFGWSVPCH